ncbi:MAG TPA: hypothetical protein VKT74_07250 [Gammaproteobacteria bacterium]|nr:hypothetical protein [Gammaproteobacteria bacterium]
MKTRILLISALLAAPAFAFAAGTAAPAAGTGAGHEHGKRYCEEHAKECTDQAAKFDQWCSANADKCQGLKAGIERRREWCESNKDECKEVREQARADMKQWCQSHPDKARCKAMDQQNEEDAAPPR